MGIVCEVSVKGPLLAPFFQGPEWGPMGPFSHTASTDGGTLCFCPCSHCLVRALLFTCCLGVWYRLRSRLWQHGAWIWPEHVSEESEFTWRASVGKEELKSLRLHGLCWRWPLVTWPSLPALRAQEKPAGWYQPFILASNMSVTHCIKQRLPQVWDPLCPHPQNSWGYKILRLGQVCLILGRTQ